MFYSLYRALASTFHLPPSTSMWLHTSTVRLNPILVVHVTVFLPKTIGGDSGLTFFNGAVQITSVLSRSHRRSGKITVQTVVAVGVIIGVVVVVRCVGNQRTTLAQSQDCTEQHHTGQTGHAVQRQRQGLLDVLWRQKSIRHVHQGLIEVLDALVFVRKVIRGPGGVGEKEQEHEQGIGGGAAGRFVTARGVQEGGQEQQSAPTGERDGKGGQVPRLLGKQEKGVEKSGKAKHGEEHGEGTAKLGAKAGQATAHGDQHKEQF